VNVGDTFLNLNPTSDPHLWVVIAGPTSDGLVVMVNCTTKRTISDDACILEVGDHPFIEHESTINYRMGQMVSDEQLDSWRQRGILQMRKPVSPGVLQRIQEGALDSQYASHAIKKAVEATLGKSHNPPQ
jgi:hypothetical protein